MDLYLKCNDATTGRVIILHFLFISTVDYCQRRTNYKKINGEDNRFGKTRLRETKRINKGHKEKETGEKPTTIFSKMREGIRYMYISMYNYTKRHCERSGADHVKQSVFSSLSMCLLLDGNPLLFSTLPSVESRLFLVRRPQFVKNFPEIKCPFHLFSLASHAVNSPHDI